LVPAGDTKSATFTGHLVGTTQMQATIAGPLTGNSGVLTVIPGPADHLEFIQQPTSADVNAPITPAITVGIADSFGNILTSLNGTDIIISIENNPGGGVLSGTLTQPTASGVSTFNDLSIDAPGTGYTLRAESAGVSPAISNPFNIIALPVPPFLPNFQDQLRYKLPYLEQFAPGQVAPFDLMTSSDIIGPIYAYHPITPTDDSAFETLIVEEGAYEYIEGIINIRGHEGLLPILDEIIKKKKGAQI